MPLTLPARKCALFLSAFAIATAAPAITASTLLAQTSADQVYERPENRDVRSDLPKIPQVAGDHQPPVTQTPVTPEVAGDHHPPVTQTPETPEVAGEQPRTVPPVTLKPEVVGPVAVGPAAETPSGDTLPVTGLDVMILLGAAAAAGGVGFALRRGAAR